MAEIGAYYITILPSMNSFTKKVNQELGAAGKSGGMSWMQAFKASALGSALGTMAASAGNALADGLGRGIQRLDTIQNFPKVMESLGYKSEEAAASIKLIMDHLDGLPTATDDMVALTQSIADSTGDLDLATRAALGFNDMLLANGASTAEVSNATSILNRVLGKQNATVNQWASLQSVMPAQLSMVADEMLGAGHSSEELRDALNNGTVSWNDFLKAIVKLDEEGNGHVASFEEQARSMTGGIGTALDNVKNRIAAGWAAILEAIGREDIAGLIDTMSKGVRDGMKAIGDWIIDLKDRIEKSNIGENLQIIFDRIRQAISDLGDAAGSIIPDLTQALVDFIDRALQWLVDNGDTAARVIGAVGTAILAYQGYQAAVTVMNGISTAWGAINAAITAGKILGPLEGLAAGCGKIMAAGGPLAGLATSVGTAAEGMGAALAGVAVGPIAAIVAAIAAAVAVLKTLWDNNEQFREAIIGIWERIQETVGAAIDRIGETLAVVGEAFGKVLEDMQPLLDKLGELWNTVCNIIAPAIEIAIDTLALQFEGIVTTISGVIQTIVGLINGFLTGDWTMFTDGLKAVWDGVWKTLTAPVRAVFDTVAGIFDDNAKKWDEWKSGVLKKNEEIRSFVLGKWEEIKSGLGQTVDDMVQRNSKDWQTFTTNLQNWNSAAQKDFSDAWNKINEDLDKTFDGIRQGFDDAKNTALKIFDDIKNGITEKIQWAKDQIGNIIDGIKNLFNFNWSLPAPQLPHIDWHWEDIGGVVSIPSFDGISWYGKGAVFDTATLIGIGEKGKEAALPLNDTTYREIARGITGEMGGSGASVMVTGNTFIVREEADVDRIADALNRKITRERLAVA